jgi:hypothetical protein
MMIFAPENDGGVLRTPESSLLESQSFARDFSGLIYCEGPQYLFTYLFAK